MACSACNCTGTLNKPDTAVFQAETDPDARDVLSCIVDVKRCPGHPVIDTHGTSRHLMSDVFSCIHTDRGHGRMSMDV